MLVCMTYMQYVSYHPLNAIAPGEIIWKHSENPSPGSNEAYGIARDSTGIYLVGYDNAPGGSDTRWRIEKRTLTTGSLIWTRTENPSTGGNVADGVAVDSTGVYVVGYDFAPGDFEWRIEKRSLTDGALIWVQTSNPSKGGAFAISVAVDSTGVYIVGLDSVPGNFEWRMEKRSLTTGAMIWARTENPSPGFNEALHVAVDSSGIYVVGGDSIPGNFEWRLEKRTLATGSVIWTHTENPSNGDNEADGATVDSTAVYVVGYDNVPGGPIFEWRIEKRNLTTGSVIWTRTSNSHTADSEAEGVAVDSTGIYVVGYLNGPADYKWGIEKLTLDTGSIIWAQIENPSPGNDSPFGVVVDSSGIYIVGIDQIPGNLEWRIEKRTLS
jgi:hypothetical protein